MAMLKCSKRVRTRGRETSLQAMKSGKATDYAVRKPSPPNRRPVVDCHLLWSGNSPKHGRAHGRAELGVEHGQLRVVHFCVRWVAGGRSV